VNEQMILNIIDEPDEFKLLYRGTINIVVIQKRKKVVSTDKRPRAIQKNMNKISLCRFRSRIAHAKKRRIQA